MPRIIFISRYLKNAGKGKVKNYVKYIATRPHAEKFSMEDMEAATEKQIQWIEKELKKNPELKERCQFIYEDYLQRPTRVNATELISSIAEQNIFLLGEIDNYVGYLAKRPGAERSEQGHALWNGSDETIDLNKVAKMTSEHKGIIWTHVISIRREDATRLGFDHADAWRDIVKSHVPDIAKEMNIPLENLVWYGAFHDEGHHPHIHLMCYSKNPREGFLSNQGIENLRRTFAKDIFRDDLYHIYEKKDEMRNSLKELFDDELEKAIGAEHEGNPLAEALLLKLAENLKTSKHKKVYGRLDRENKLLVDAIVSEISKDEKINAVYQSWLGLKDEVLFTYQNKEKARRSLVDESEFRSIKNMVLKSAVRLSEEADVFQIEQEEETEEQAKVQKTLEEIKKQEHKEKMYQDFARTRSKQEFLRLLKNISRMIEDDYHRQQKVIPMTEKKLLRKIKEKKEALGQKL